MPAAGVTTWVLSSYHRAIHMDQLNPDLLSRGSRANTETSSIRPCRSNCVDDPCYQVVAGKGFQGWLSRTMALSMHRRCRMQAVMATLEGLPLAFRRT